MKYQVEQLNKIRVTATAIGINKEARKNQEVQDCVQRSVNTVCDICTFAALFSLS